MFTELNSILNTTPDSFTQVRTKCTRCFTCVQSSYTKSITVTLFYRGNLSCSRTDRVMPPSSFTTFCLCTYEVSSPVNVNLSITVTRETRFCYSWCLILPVSLSPCISSFFILYPSTLQSVFSGSGSILQPLQRHRSETGESCVLLHLMLTLSDEYSVIVYIHTYLFIWTT